MLDRKIKVVAIIIGSTATIFGLITSNYKDVITGGAILVVTWVYSQIKRKD